VLPLRSAMKRSLSEAERPRGSTLCSLGCSICVCTMRVGDASSRERTRSRFWSSCLCDEKDRGGHVDVKIVYATGWDKGVRWFVLDIG
jgi:hypothetical protein